MQREYYYSIEGIGFIPTHEKLEEKKNKNGKKVSGKGGLSNGLTSTEKEKEKGHMGKSKMISFSSTMRDQIGSEREGRSDRAIEKVHSSPPFPPFFNPFSFHSNSQSKELLLSLSLTNRPLFPIVQ